MANLKTIREYIDTGDGTPGTLLIPKLIMPTLIKEAEKALLPRELAATVITPNQIQGSTFNFNLETPRTMKVRVVAEGAEIPMDEQDFESIEFAPVKYGVAIRITREMIEDSQFPLLQLNLATVGRRFAEKETELVLAALDTANSTVAGGAAITIANITEAMQTIEDEDYNPTDFVVGMEVLNDLRNIDTFVEASKVGNTDMLQRGFLGNIYGLSVTKFSSNVGTKTNSYVLDRSQAYAIAIKRDLTVENFDLPTYDMQGAAATMRIDVKALRSKAITKITTS